MDQGNTDPNNPNPIASPPAPADAPTPPVDQFMPNSPAPAPIFPTDPNPTPAPESGTPSWGNPTTTPPAPAPFAPPAPAEPVAFAQPSMDAQPTAFNPFSAPTPEVASTSPSIPPSTSTESAPTDLTSLAGNSSEATNYVPQPDTSFPPATAQPSPESLVASPSISSEPAQAVTAQSGSGGFPKIIFAVGGVILLIVIAASAYFIFGVGKSSAPAETSVPAVQQEPLSTPAPLIPEPTASTSLPSSTTSTSSAVPTGTGSAYDLLRQRQASTGSANR